VWAVSPLCLPSHNDDDGGLHTIPYGSTHGLARAAIAVLRAEAQWEKLYKGTQSGISRIGVGLVSGEHAVHAGGAIGIDFRVSGTQLVV
jgi:hypothetical protein